ncbi:MAG: tyrosine-type recombinase/integrase [Spirochaetes bacterium]|nr:tyrosine-type recombinase/integrase [Spirochaetota bacterium]
MIIRGLSRETQKMYTSCINRLFKYFKRDLSALTAKDLQHYQVHLARRRRLSASSINTYVSAFRFFFSHVITSDFNTREIPFSKSPERVPVVFDRLTAKRLYDLAGSARDRALFLLMYGSGLRVSEVCSLRISDIDSSLMRIKVFGKGSKGRYVILSQAGLLALRAYWRSCKVKPVTWLFYGDSVDKALSRQVVYKVVRDLGRCAGLGFEISPHTLRHSFASQLLSDGVDLRKIQLLLGHAVLESTSVYLQVSGEQLRAVVSPAEHF